MGWIHRHKRQGAMLALAALALQIVLAFGHVHLNQRRLTGDSQVAIAAQHHGALARASSQGPAQSPGDDDDYCAICASIFLASTSFTPAPPALPVPVGFQRIEHSFDNARGLAEPRLFAFQSRAPPPA
jgi:hypothetical protein